MDEQAGLLFKLKKHFFNSLGRPNFYYHSTTWCEASLLTQLRIWSLESKMNERLDRFYREMAGQRESIEVHLRTQCLLPSCLITEIASSFVEIGSKLDLIVFGTPPSSEDMKSLKKKLNSRFFKRKWVDSEIRDNFGIPQFEVNGGGSISLCYGDRQSQWIFFDFQRSDFLHRVIYDQPVLRNIRWQGNIIKLVEPPN